MTRGHLELLGHGDIERILATSVRILGELGVVIHSEPVCTLLEERGCNRSEDDKRMRIPEDVVRSAVSSGTKAPVLLAARDKRHDILIPSGRTYMANGGEGVYVKNLITGERHSATMRDFTDFTALAEALPQVDFVWGMVGATELPAHLKELAELKVFFENSSKHFQGGALSAEQARGMIEIGSILSGGREELARRPIFSGVQCPLSPLTFEKGVAEAQVELARAGIPVVAMSAPIAGLTSPVTISGTIAQTTAENLASLVISQTGKKGAPFIFSSDSSPADMKSGSIDYGGMESPLMHLGCGQMGRHLGLSTMVSGASVQEASLLLGTVQEGVPLMLMEAMIPSDLGSGFGGIDNALGASLEQFVADAWIWDIAREMARDFEMDASAISYETVKNAVKGGSYLSQAHTIMRFRKEIISASRPEMSPLGREAIEGRGALLRNARAEAERILREPRKPFITNDESRSLKDLFKRFKSA